MQKKLANTPTTDRGSMGDNKPLIVVSARLPVTIQKDPETGEERFIASNGGVATALTSAQPFPWKWYGFLEHGRQEEFTLENGITCQSMPISPQERNDFLNGYCNSILWPLYNRLKNRIHQEDLQKIQKWFNAYRSMNYRVADILSKDAPPGSTVWINDYQLQLVPAMLRQKRPDLALGFFLHIPFPHLEDFRLLPQGHKIIEGLLGSDQNGFQTAADRNNFLEAANALHQQAPLRVNGKRVHIEYDHSSQQQEATRAKILVGNREVGVDNFPISIDFEKYNNAANDPKILAYAAAIKEMANGRKLAIGMERQDYIKGIPQRFEAVRELLEKGKFDPSSETYLQYAVPTRTEIGEYNNLAQEIADKVKEINENPEWQSIDPVTGRTLDPVILIPESVPPEIVAAIYLAADVMFITSIADGMNVMAKEYVATRSNETGVLILSTGAGAAEELPEALLVTIEDVPAAARKASVTTLAQAIRKALDMPPAEQRAAMIAMRTQVANNQVKQWRENFLNATHARAQAAQDQQPKSGKGSTRLSQVATPPLHPPGSSPKPRQR